MPDREAVAQDGGPTTRASPQTFEQFYAAKFRDMTRMAFLLTGDREAAPEIVQEVFARMYLRWATVDRPDAYASRSVANAAASFYRQRAAGQRRSKRLALERPTPPPDTPEHLEDLIASLSRRQQEVLVLRYYFELSTDDIADTLEMRRGSVGPTLQRALKRLRKELS